MNFSQRIGIEPKELPVQKESMSAELRNCLWNILWRYYESCIKSSSGYDAETYWFGHGKDIFNHYWHNFFKYPLDIMPDSPRDAVSNVRSWFFKCDWNKIYEFIEFTASILPKNEAERFMVNCNHLLERENSAYRFIGGYIGEIISKQEIESIEISLNLKKPYAVVSQHIESALEKWSNKIKPDYRNSIKESISAIEAIAKVITNQPNATLGNILKLEKLQTLHPAFRAGLSKIYGYTSDSDGIRHALTEDIQSLTANEARLMLILCSAFTNYLIAKIN